MKTRVLTILFALFVGVVYAQEITKVGKLVEVKEGSERTEVALLNNRIHIEDNYGTDTTHIRVGKRSVEIVEEGGKTNINMQRDRFFDDDDKDWGDSWRRKNFNGHWAGFELGVNGFFSTDYSAYAEGDFMDLNQAKSIEVNFNFLEYNIALSPDRIGLVTGMGWSINNYRFDNPLTIEKQDGIIVPVPIEKEGFDKSKLTASYLTVPLLLEFQIPVNGGSNEVFVSGGVVGALNIGSHTKIKANSSKSKDHGSFAINPFKYSVVGRIGLKDISLFASYGLSTFFKDDKGPELYPFTIGISLLNF